MIGRRLKTAGDFLFTPSPTRLEGLASPRMVQRPRLTFAIAAGVIIVGYALLINPYWHFTVDSCLYLALARNLVEGHGYTYNGVPHCQAPGGWAYTLSLLLRVSRSFLWLNVVQMLTMLTALAVLYLVLKEVLEPGGAAVILVLTAFSIWIYEYAMALMSETPFFLFSNIALLLLLRATRGASRRARTVYVIGLCVAASVAFIFRLVASFWIGPLAVALLLENRAERRLPERLVSAAAICAVLVSCYMAYKYWGESVAMPPVEAQPVATASVVEAGQSVYPPPSLSIGRLLFNLKFIVFWPAWLLWPPSGLVQRMSIRQVAWLVALGPNVIVAFGCYRAARRGQILVAASVLFFGPFLTWSTGGKATTGRYAMAVVPFVAILFLLGLRQMGELLRDRLRIPVKPGLLVALGAASVLLPSLLFFCVDVWVQRSPEYYAKFRGGGYTGLMGSLKWLRQHDVPEPVAARDHATLRAIVCVTGYRAAEMGRDVKPVKPGFEEAARKFAAETGVRYILTMDKAHLGRWPIWHIPRQYLGGEPLPPDFWQIWRYDPERDELSRIPVQHVSRWPTELPGGRGEP